MVQAACYDAVLMDMQMPVRDGVTATREIRKLPKFRDLPILAMTANAMAEDRQKTMDAGMNDYIVKPIDPANLFSALLNFIPPRRVADAPPQEGPAASAKDVAALRIEGVDVDAERVAHTLKGVAGTIGAVSIQDFFRPHLNTILGAGSRLDHGPGLCVIEFLVAEVGPGDGGISVVAGSHKADLACPGKMLKWQQYREYVTEINAKAGDAAGQIPAYLDELPEPQQAALLPPTHHAMKHSCHAGESVFGRQAYRKIRSMDQA